ncbi:glycosyltransferase family 39 protein [Clostridium sp. YIM B02505]|uniref:Glycosyltransferase family 39 protein n=1 Tax=Clostridium yunnanense TaxID=2800325 RepID=A0ABS1END6_9CLOT|nr:glycosyltransferase family 39 protein [Clostridium yunnanense]MBK1810859.1 glycosyltransferase family 39 protein [Clostridium yunnanense]
MVGFSKFVLVSLRIIFFPIIIVATILLAMYIKKDMYLFAIVVMGLMILLGFVLYQMIKKGCSKKTILIFIFLVGFVLRLSWALSIDNKPISDFNRAYIVAGDFLDGNLSGFQGTHYIARFPHLTGLVLYFALFRSIFTYPLVALKVVNVILSSINIIITYGICRVIFKNDVKKAYYGAFLTALYPPLVIYTGVFCTENMAIPFYLLSLYTFILGLDRDKKYIVASGFLLMIGHFFRAVGQVMIVAYFMMIFIYTKEIWLVKIKKSLLLVLAFIIPFLSINSILRYEGITQYDLWKGSETAWTSVLKGTNQDSWGRWNHEDAIMFDKYEDDNEALAKACKEEIKRRITTTPVGKLAIFYLRKFSFQWREGDFSASYWAVLGVDGGRITINTEERGALLFQVFYLVLLILSYLSLYNKRSHNENPLVIIFYVIFCGYSLLYLITESQDRYSFIACWLMIFMTLNNSEETIVIGQRNDIVSGVFNGIIIPMASFYILASLKVNNVLSISLGYLIGGIVQFVLSKKNFKSIKLDINTSLIPLISVVISMIVGSVMISINNTYSFVRDGIVPIPIAIIVTLINYLLRVFLIKERGIDYDQKVSKHQEQL